MPLIQVTMAQGRTREQKRALIRGLSDTAAAVRGRPTP